MTYHPICPKPYEPTEKEHLAAQRKYFTIMLSEELLGIYMLLTGSMPRSIDKPRDEEMIERFSGLLNKLYDGPFEDEDYEMNNLVGDLETFKKNWGTSLKEEHGGDCVAQSASCIRCYAEELYDLPSSITWKGKHEGARLFGEWLRIQNKKEEINEKK